jgi:hypothetical protein
MRENTTIIVSQLSDDLLGALGLGVLLLQLIVAALPLIQLLLNHPIFVLHLVLILGKVPQSGLQLSDSGVVLHVADHLVGLHVLQFLYLHLLIVHCLLQLDCMTIMAYSIWFCT